jgi:hypothetical protein
MQFVSPTFNETGRLESVPEGVSMKHAKEYRATGLRCVPGQDRPQLLSTLSTPSYGVFYSVLAAGPTGTKGMDKDRRD